MGPPSLFWQFLHTAAGRAPSDRGWCRRGSPTCRPYGLFCQIGVCAGWWSPPLAIGLQGPVTIALWLPCVNWEADVLHFCLHASCLFPCIVFLSHHSVVRRSLPCSPNAATGFYFFLIRRFRCRHCCLSPFVGLKTPDCGYSQHPLAVLLGHDSTGHAVPRLCHAALSALVFFFEWTHSLFRANADSWLGNLLLLGSSCDCGALCSGHQSSIDLGPLWQNVPNVCMFGCSLRSGSA